MLIKQHETLEHPETLVKHHEMLVKHHETVVKHCEKLTFRCCYIGVWHCNIGIRYSDCCVGKTLRMCNEVTNQDIIMLYWDSSSRNRVIGKTSS